MERAQTRSRRVGSKKRGRANAGNRSGEVAMIRSAAHAVFFALAAHSAFADTVAFFPVRSGAHPHDVAAPPDGSVWYTAQNQGALGILDPKTGKVEQVPL